MWIQRETRVRNATLSTSRLKEVASMPTFDLDKKLQPGSSLHFTLCTVSPAVEPWPAEEGAQPIPLQHHSWEKTSAALEPVGREFGWLWVPPTPPPPHQTSCQSPSPHTCTATSLGRRLPAHARVPLWARTAHQPGCSHRHGQHRTGALGVDAGWSPWGFRALS